MIQSYTYTSDNPWPSLIFLWAIHGNEPCGTIAINHICNHLGSGEIQLIRGSLTCIPVCNPQAASLNVRQIDRNLNRIFCHHNDPIAYEEKLANEIITILQQTSYDILVDCHSWHTSNAHFVFQDYDDPDTKYLAESTGMKTIIHGRPALYETSNDMDTWSYAHSQGKTTITIEWWQHDEPEAITRTYNALINILQSYNMITWKPYINPNQNHIQMYAIIKKEKLWHFVRYFSHWDYIAHGEHIIEYEDGSIYRADRDCVIILPKHYATNLWQERFYLWEYFDV